MNSTTQKALEEITMSLGVETVTEINFLVNLTLAEQAETNDAKQSEYLTCFGQLEEDAGCWISRESRQMLIKSVLVGLAGSTNPQDFELVLEKSLVLATELQLHSEESQLESLLEALE